MSKGLDRLQRTAEILEKREKLKQLKAQRELRHLQHNSPHQEIESLLYHGSPRYPSNQGMWEEDAATPYINNKERPQVLQNDLTSTTQQQNGPYGKPTYYLLDKGKSGGNTIPPHVDDNQPSRDLRGDQISGTPMKPRIRAKRLSYMHLIFAWVRKIARPRLKPGHRRIEWTCVSACTPRYVSKTKNEQ